MYVKCYRESRLLIYQNLYKATVDSKFLTEYCPNANKLIVYNCDKDSVESNVNIRNLPKIQELYYLDKCLSCDFSNIQNFPKIYLNLTLIKYKKYDNVFFMTKNIYNKELLKLINKSELEVIHFTYKDNPIIYQIIDE